MTTPSLERMLPLYEAKMIHHYDHRWATYEPDGSIRNVTLEEKQNPNFVVLPRYWVRESVVKDRLDGRWDREWLLGWRRIARSTDIRTFIPTVVPRAAFGDSVFLMLPTVDPDAGRALQAIVSSFVFDFVARQKIGGTNASFFLIEQLPLPTLAVLREPVLWTRHMDWAAWLSDRTMDATDRPGRGRARTELDAACFHLYGLGREEVAYVMDTFSILRSADSISHGEYRTKRLILETYDGMAEAIASGTPYTSPFDEE
ncbi:hypothetical protein [Nocardioides sp. ChNu-99]|uniref:hypothetical protein n=1 Tax=Nocardioides sp. ChNu-99 TaxID=2839897 RepID=UPI00240600AC|nr:hypothetical protein [Nocardioides sp. ChNu-99]MDF9717344.1 hypothetical protein [Nocardioides sp. ChNu-99]